MNDQWQELKDTIIELRDNDGTGTQQEVCKFLVNYMEVLEKQMQEPCGNAISRQAVLNALYALCDTGESLKENPWRDNPHIDAVIETIEELPPVTPQSKTGHWIYICNSEVNGLKIVKCSECGKRTYGSGKYCPNCGIKMVEPQERSDKE